MNDTATTSESLRNLADFLDANPDIAEKALRHAQIKLLVSYSEWGENAAEKARASLAAFARAGKAAGAEVSKTYDDTYGNVLLRFGPVEIEGYAAREQVCIKRVVGTREVTKTVPDPDALAAVPTVEVTETVEDVEWDCLPLLAETPAGVSA